MSLTSRTFFIPMYQKKKMTTFHPSSSIPSSQSCNFESPVRCQTWPNFSSLPELASLIPDSFFVTQNSLSLTRSVSNPPAARIRSSSSGSGNAKGGLASLGVLPPSSPDPITTGSSNAASSAKGGQSSHHHMQFRAGTAGSTRRRSNSRTLGSSSGGAGSGGVSRSSSAGSTGRHRPGSRE